MHEYDAQRWNIHAVCYTFIPLSLWPTVRQRINRERERESMVQIRGCVSSDMGVTFSDVTPMYLYNKQFTVDSVSTRNKGWL